MKSYARVRWAVPKGQPPQSDTTLWKLSMTNENFLAGRRCRAALNWGEAAASPYQTIKYTG